MTTIPSGVFQGITAESFTIPEGITSIGDYAFCYSNLSGVAIPESVTSIGYDAFGECYNLSSVIFESAEAPDLADDGSAFGWGQYAYDGTIYHPAGASDYTEAWRDGIWGFNDGSGSPWTLAPVSITEAAGTTSLDFEELPINTLSTDKSLEITGTNLLDVISYEITGDTEAFIITELPTARGVGDTTRNYRITFSPKEEKDYTATLTLQTYVAPALTITLTGRGIAPLENPDPPVIDNPTPSSPGKGLPVSPTSPVPTTGDNNPLFLAVITTCALAGMGMLLIGLTGLLTRRKRGYRR
jgi:hypothetical protein